MVLSHRVQQDMVQLHDVREFRRVVVSSADQLHLFSWIQRFISGLNHFSRSIFVFQFNKPKSNFRSLRCARISVHMNLFASFAMNNFLWLLWYNFVVDRPEIVKENTVSITILVTHIPNIDCSQFYTGCIIFVAFWYSLRYV
ncbi:pdf receptor-like protein-related [Holotrichia oblita]|uniref:Pdf receptor-like protein-related n=1 Tax=Holotrichia oblita TaxID=644536 RepID=A0ACB9T2W1_HOLOL|nr:pdf receptor-like protein-related [Holotrichia oblita]